MINISRQLGSHHSIIITRGGRIQIPSNRGGGIIESPLIGGCKIQTNSGRRGAIMGIQITFCPQIKGTLAQMGHPLPL